MLLSFMARSLRQVRRCGRRSAQLDRDRGVVTARIARRARLYGRSDDPRRQVRRNHDVVHTRRIERELPRVPRIAAAPGMELTVDVDEAGAREVRVELSAGGRVWLLGAQPRVRVEGRA